MIYCIPIMLIANVNKTMTLWTAESRKYQSGVLSTCKSYGRRVVCHTFLWLSLLAPWHVSAQAAVEGEGVEHAAHAAGHAHGAHGDHRAEQGHQIAAQETADTSSCRPAGRRGTKRSHTRNSRLLKANNDHFPFPPKKKKKWR